MNAISTIHRATWDFADPGDLFPGPGVPGIQRRRSGLWAATMELLRPAPTDTTTTILIPARRTDITAQIGSITASFWASVPGTVGAGAAVADTGATTGADAAGVAVDMDIAAATDTVADTDITVDMHAAGMATMAATAVDIMAAGLTPVADTTVAVADTMAVVAEDSTAAVAVDSTVAAVAEDSTVAAVAMVVAGTDSRQII